MYRFLIFFLTYCYCTLQLCNWNVVTMSSCEISGTFFFMHFYKLEGYHVVDSSGLHLTFGHLIIDYS